MSLRPLAPSQARVGSDVSFRSLLLLLVLPHFLPLRASAETSYPPVVPGHELAFPRDEGSHPDFRIEWWYVTGQLDDGASKVKAPLGFQVTFFRVRTGLAADNPSSFAPRQVLFAHAAVADPVSGKLHHAQRSARTGFDLAYAREGQLDVKLDDWSIRQVAPGRYVTAVHGEDFDFDLTLVSTQPPLLQGERGFSRKGPDPRAASYYYSLPQLAVSGEVTVGGSTRKVSGQAWFDHEWSSDYVDERCARMGLAGREHDRRRGAHGLPYARPSGWLSAGRVRRCVRRLPPALGGSEDLRGGRGDSLWAGSGALDAAAVLAFPAHRCDLPGPVARAGR